MKSQYLLTGLLAFSLLSGCNSPKQPQSSPTPASTSAPSATSTPEEVSMPKVNFTDEDKALAEKMLQTWKDGYFDSKEARKKENARGFLYLASESTDKKQQIGALKVLKEIYVDYETDKKLMVDDDYRTVVLPLLKSSEPATQQAAIEACYSVVRGKTPHPETLAVLIDLANNHPEASGRWQAANSLSATTGKTDHPELVETFFKLYQDEDFVIASAVNWTPVDFAQDEKLRERTLKVLLELAKHQNHVIRGRSIDKYGLLSKDKAATAELAKKMLEDPEPFVVAEALKVLGETKDESHIPTIAKYFDDSRESKTKLQYPKLDGNKVTSSLGGLTGNTVADVATRALDDITDGRPDKGFKAGKVSFGKSKDGDIAKNVAAAKEWVAQNK